MIWPYEGGVISDSFLFGKRLNQRALGYPLRSVLVVRVIRKLFGVFGWGPALSFSPHLGKYLANHIKANFPAETIVVISHPWLGRVVKYLENYQIVYFAHNVESEIIRDSNLGVLRKSFLSKYVNRLEMKVVKMADKVVFVSETDQSKFEKVLMGIENIVVGVGTKVPKTSAEKRKQNVLFVGGDYLFNLEAAEALLQIAAEVTEIKFIIVGEVCNKLETDLANVSLLGWVSEGQLQEILTESSLFVNPMIHGSGIHLKLIKAMAHTIPILTTPVGWRGFDKVENLTAVVVPVEDFKGAIKIIFNDYEKYQKFAVDNAKIVMKTYSWENVCQEFNKFVAEGDATGQFYDPSNINHELLSYENRKELPWKQIVSWAINLGLIKIKKINP